jgi:hypothetical protein
MKHRFSRITSRFIAVTASLIFAIFPAQSFASQLSPIQISPGIYAFIGETGMRTYENEGMNANAGFIVSKAGVVVVDSGPSYRVAKPCMRDQKGHVAADQP